MRNSRVKLLLVFTILLIPVCVGCRATKLHRAAGYTNYAQIEAVGESDLCPFGMPESQPGWNHGPTVVVERTGYALEHSSLDKIPLWVCEHVEADHLTGTADRNDCGFKMDRKLPSSARSKDSDYTNSGYDRGHQAPAADFKYDQDIMCESFFMSNVAPQVGDGFNQDIWENLEGRTRSCITEYGEGYVVTGGFFYDPEEEDEDTADGIINYYVIGKGKVAVPTHFYKIVVAKDSAGDWQANAFVLENIEHEHVTGDAYDFTPYVRSIEWIEERTGLNFMPKLDSDNPDLAERLESDPAALWTCFGVD